MKKGSVNSRVFYLKTKHGIRRGRPISYDNDVIIFEDARTGRRRYAHVDKLTIYNPVYKN